MRSSRSLRLTALAAVVPLALLVGCGGAESTDPDSPLASVTVSDPDPDSEEGGDTPTVQIEDLPLEVTETTTRVLTPGADDAETVDDLALVSMTFALYGGVDGRELQSSFGQDPVGLDMSEPGLLPGLETGLSDAVVGSRLLIAMPPAEAFGEQGNAALDIGAGETVLLLVDVLSATTPLSEASGEAVEPKKGLPTVAVTTGEAAVITIPEDTDPPEDTVVQRLITGEGPAVEAGQSIRVAYTGALWRNGEVFDSSARTENGYTTFQIGTGNVIKGWDTGLVDQPVGSRVLLVIPPKDGYGEAGSGDIQGDDTLVFVVDILAAY